MLTDIAIPPSFTLFEKNRVFFLLRKEYKDLLLQQGIEDLTTFLKTRRPNTRYLIGRTPHPSILLEDGKRMIIRQYSHGGLLRFFTRNLYSIGSRAFRELVLTEEIRSCGIPTVQPIGAIHRPVFLSLYQAYLLTLEIPHAKDLIQFFQEIGPRPIGETLLRKRRMIRSAGLLIQNFHQKGFFHRDLHLRNILVAEGQFMLIDFDRSYRKETLSVGERMKNLLRLNRSVEKWRRLGLPITRTDRWRFFLAYAGDDGMIRNAMQKAIRTYSARHFLYRCGWSLQKIVRS